MSSKPALKRILCAQCERTEADCLCEKYCVFCQSELEVRLCSDGLMCCDACRTACDYKLAN